MIKNWWQDKYFKRLMGVFLIWKVMSFIVVVWGFRLLPFCLECWWGNFLYPRPQELTWTSVLKTWDGQHYLFLAEVGYAPGQMSNAFFPLWPMVIRGARQLLGGGTLMWGMMLAQIFSLAVVVVFYRLVVSIGTKLMAFRASLLLMSFPTAFYLHLPYSESLFLFLVLVCIYSVLQRKWIAVVLTMFCLPLARIQGWLMLVPLIVGRLGSKKASSLPYLVASGMFLLGVGAYLGLMQMWTGDYWGGFAALEKYKTVYSARLLLQPWEWLRVNFLAEPLVLHNFNVSVIDRLFLGGFLLVLLLAVRQKLQPMFLAVMLMLGLVVALSGRLVSYPRYLLVVFPMYVVMARALKENYLVMVIAGLMLQMLFLLLHSLNYWVA